MPFAAPATPVDLKRVRVRLIKADERAQWDVLMRAHHYLGFVALVGRSLRYVAEIDGHWLALLGWASGALKVASRDDWIGWSPTLQWQRLACIANNSRFLILPGERVKNLASRILGLNLACLSQDWQLVHGHRLILAETFIDPARFTGTCYRAANWVELGHTRGFSKSNDTYTAHGQQKRIWVYPLHPQAQSILSGAVAHPALPRLEVKMMVLSDTDAQALFARLTAIDDPRAKRGLRHQQRSLLAIILCAVISGAQGSTAIGEWVKRLPVAMLRRLRCRRAQDGSYERPSEPTIRRMLKAIDIEQLERQLGGWLQTQGERGEPIALDGKVLRGTRSIGSGKDTLQLVSAFGHHSGMVMNQVAVPDKASEMKAVKPLLDAMELSGRVVTADALHTQTETAQYLVEEKGAHYLFTVKDNQATLKADIASLHMEASPP
ncbi:ISAs1 family transposase [Rhodoferax sp.]|uniref:ISAs1 family transposase n=1 Tax=Rhodoferax sp. TaxID=50421 RepID=UPI0027487586|nr:ISAs1 family transposase [Rhodoferax sp.]